MTFLKVRHAIMILLDPFIGPGDQRRIVAWAQMSSRKPPYDPNLSNRRVHALDIGVTRLRTA